MKKNPTYVKILQMITDEIGTDPIDMKNPPSPEVLVDRLISEAFWCRLTTPEISWDDLRRDMDQILRRCYGRTLEELA